MAEAEAWTRGILAVAWIALTVATVAWRAGVPRLVGKDLLFYFFVLSLATGIALGVFAGGDWFAVRFPTAPNLNDARPPLGVAGGSLVLLIFALVDLVGEFVGGPLDIRVPRHVSRTLPGLVAVAVGGLIGTTVFK